MTDAVGSAMADIRRLRELRDAYGPQGCSTGPALGKGFADGVLGVGRRPRSALGHMPALLHLHWAMAPGTVYSAAADATLASWDTETGQRIRRHIGHEEIVNTLDVSRRGLELLVSGGDDGKIGVWDPRQKWAADHFDTDFPIAVVAWAEAGNEIFTGGIGSLHPEGGQGCGY